MTARKTCVYKAYDASGSLLYVGASFSLVERLRSHSSRSDWLHDVARIDLEWFPSREAALDAERTAILLEMPRLNIRNASPENRFTGDPKTVHGSKEPSGCAGSNPAAQKKQLLAYKADPDFHSESHAAARSLGTTVSAEIKKLMQRLINEAARKGGE